MQTIHWFTRPGMFHEQVIVLLNSILDGLYSESSLIRDMSKRSLHEYVKWSIKQNTSLDGEKNTPIKSLFRRLFSLWTHPIQTHRSAASMAFNSIYVLFREEPSLVEIYTIEIACKVILSISINKNVECPESNDTLKHLVRIIVQKRRLFEGEKQRRRVPFEFPVGSEASLNDFLNWLAQWITKPNTEVRHKALEIIYHLSPNVKSLLQVDELRSHIANEIKSVSGSVEDMERIIACLEISRWLVDQRVVSFDHLGIDFEVTLIKVLRVNDFNATKDP